MKKKIAIIGAGIAGLTLANLLKTNSNFEFIIYEKDDFLNLEEGYGIQLSVNSISVLNKIGFDQLNKNEKYNPSRLDFYSMNYKKICELDLTKFNFENTKYTTLKRSILINFLKEKLFSNSLMFRKKINKIKEVGEKINLYFIDGSKDVVDFLIISDGVFTDTKSIVEKKKIKRNYFGAIAIRSQVKAEDISNLNSNNISLIMGNNAHLVLYPVNKKKEINLVCIIRKQSEDSDSIKIVLENTVLKENKNLNNLFKGQLKSWPIYTSDKPIKSIYKKVLYVGDSFYTFPPTMAQGASQSIEAANEIFELISNNNKNIQDIYFKTRMERINLINKRSKFNYFGFHITNPLLKNFRNFLLKRLVKNKNFIQNYLGKIYK